MDGVKLNALKQIEHPQGNIYHAMKCTDQNFNGFGEAYFSFVNYGDIKGWKKHKKMYMNILVPIGEIEFVIYDDRDKSKTKNEFYSIKLSQDNYQRLSIAPGLWVGFRGCNNGQNMLLNIASIVHDPMESINLDLKDITYEW